MRTAEQDTRTAPGTAPPRRCRGLRGATYAGGGPHTPPPLSTCVHMGTHITAYVYLYRDILPAHGHIPTRTASTLTLTAQPVTA